MGKEKIAELTLNIGKDGAKLVLIGPKVGPAQPSIGVLKDEKGNYHCVMIDCFCQYRGIELTVSGQVPLTEQGRQGKEKSGKY